LLSLSKINSASRVFLVSSIMIFSISLVEAIYGLIYNSSLLIVDSYHGFVDASTSLLFSITLKVAYKRNKKYWALYNLENLGVLISSAIILFLVIDYIRGVAEISVKVPYWLSIITWISALITLSIYYFEREYNWISVVKSDMIHSKLDFAMEIISGFAIVSENFLFNLIIILSIVSFIVVDTFRELKEAIMSLIGANYNGSLKDEISKALKKANINVLKIYVRRLGSFYMVYLIIGLPSNVTLRKAYRVRKKASKIAYSFDPVISVEVKIVPQKSVPQLILNRE